MRRRLYRSRSDRMLLGVAGGMADWFDLDPSVVRLVWALLILAAGVGIPLYIVAAIVIPEEPLGGAMAADAGAAAMSAADGGQTAATAAGASEAASDDWAARRQARRAARAERDGGGAIIFGAILIALGGWFLLDRFVNIDSELLLPGVLIALGAVLVVGALRKPRGR